MPDFDETAALSGSSDPSLPGWQQIKSEALDRLHAARNEMSEVGNLLRGIDSPLTPAEREMARVARMYATRIKQLIDEAKEALGG